MARDVKEIQNTLGEIADSYVTASAFEEGLRSHAELLAEGFITRQEHINVAAQQEQVSRELRSQVASLEEQIKALRHCVQR